MFLSKLSASLHPGLWGHYWVKSGSSKPWLMNHGSFFKKKSMFLLFLYFSKYLLWGGVSFKIRVTKIWLCFPFLYIKLVKETPLLLVTSEGKSFPWETSDCKQKAHIALRRVLVTSLCHLAVCLTATYRPHSPLQQVSLNHCAAKSLFSKEVE